MAALSSPFMRTTRGGTAAPDTNVKNMRARTLYHALGYEEVGIVQCVFKGIPDVHLVCLEKYLGKN